MRRFIASEAVWVALIAVLAGWWGTRYVTQFRAEGGSQSFYQQYFEPAVMAACGRGFVSAVQAPAALDDFLRQRTDTFECALLPTDAPLLPASAVYQYAWFYLMWTVGLFWNLFGVSWSAISVLLGVLFAFVIVLAYLLARLTLPPWPAVLVPVALATSQLHLPNLPHLRDYAKAPLVLALLLVMCWIVKRGTTTIWLLLVAGLYGLIVGIGYGFRTDLLANIPPFAVAVIVFVPGFGVRPLAMKAAALAIAAAVFFIIASPVVSYVSRMAGCQWHVVLLGLDRTHGATLGVTSSYYQWLTDYSDEYVLTAVNSAQFRFGRPTVQYCAPGYDAASGAYLAAIASQFPADVVTRAQASIARVMDLPFYLWTDRHPAIRRSTVGKVLTNFAGTARVAVVLSVLALGAINLRWGLFAVFVVAYFGSYPSMQFAPRHFFHFEVLGWWAMVFVGWKAWLVVRPKLWKQDLAWPDQPRRLLARGFAFAIAIAVAVGMPATVVRAYHERSVDRLTEGLLRAPRVPVTSSLGPDGLDLDMQFAAAPNDLTQTVYLDVQIDLDACPGGVELGLRYDPSDPFQDFSNTIVPQPSDTVPQRVLVPVYRGFRGLSIGEAPLECIRSVERLQSLDGLSLLPVLTLPKEWTRLPKHQTLGPVTWRTWGILE